MRADARATGVISYIKRISGAHSAFRALVYKPHSIIYTQSGCRSYTHRSCAEALGQQEFSKPTEQDILQLLRHTIPLSA